MGNPWQPEVKKDFSGTGGARPQHVHRCPDCKEPWSCDSAYCNYVTRRCPDCGGSQPKHDEDGGGL